jgi:hypothetical protein
MGSGWGRRGRPADRWDWPTVALGRRFNRLVNKGPELLGYRWDLVPGQEWGKLMADAIVPTSMGQARCPMVRVERRRL